MKSSVENLEDRFPAFQFLRSQQHTSNCEQISKSWLLNKKRKQTWHVLSEKTLDDTGLLIPSPRKPLRRLSHKPGVSKSFVHAATKLLLLQPDKFTVEQNLKETDRAARERCCTWFCKAVCNVVLGPFLTYFTNEAWFYLNGHVNTQNSRYVRRITRD
jgi:hypothetical protein